MSEPRSVVALCCIRDQRYLLMVQKNGKHWIFPGGKSEPGEIRVETLAREVREELPGAEITRLEYWRTFDNVSPSGSSIRVHIFLGDLDGDWHTANEITGWGWYSKIESCDFEGLTPNSIQVIEALEREGLLI